MGLVCELCGGSNFVKKDGAFECQDCGCKYSVEEARALMSGGGALNPAPVFVPTRDNELESLKNNCIQAFKDVRYDRVIELSDRIQEKDADNAIGLMYHGMAVFCLYDKRPDDINQAKALIIRGIDQIMKSEDFSENYDEVLISCLKAISKAYSEFTLLYINNYKSYLKQSSSLYSSAALKRKGLGAAQLFGGMTQFEMARKEDEIKALEQQAAEYKSMSGQMQKKALNLAVVFDPIIIEYDKMLKQKEYFSMSLYDELSKISDGSFNFWGGSNSNNDIILKHWQAISNTSKGKKQKYEATVLKAEKDKAHALYWEAHAEEKAALEQEKADLEAEIEGLNDRLVPYDAQIMEIKREEESKKNQITAGFNSQISGIEQEISSLNNTMKSLSIFKVKEKKQLQEQINQKSSEISSLKTKIEEAEKQSKIDTAKRTKSISDEKTPILQEITKRKDRISEIEAEFTKDRRETAE